MSLDFPTCTFKGQCNLDELFWALSQLCDLLLVQTQFFQVWPQFCCCVLCTLLQLLYYVLIHSNNLYTNLFCRPCTYNDRNVQTITHSSAHALFFCFQNSARKKGLVNSSTRFSESQCACALLFLNSARNIVLVNLCTCLNKLPCCASASLLF